MRSLKKERGVVLLMTLGMVLIVIILADVILSIIASQSRLTHHRVSRTRAYYASQAGMNYALEMLRSAAWTANPMGGANRIACLNGCVTTGIIVDWTIPADADIPYSVQVTIFPRDGNNISRLDTTTEYTWTLSP